MDGRVGGWLGGLVGRRVFQCACPAPAVMLSTLGLEGKVESCLLVPSYFQHVPFGTPLPKVQLKPDLEPIILFYQCLSISIFLGRRASGRLWLERQQQVSAKPNLGAEWTTSGGCDIPVQSDQHML